MIATFMDTFTSTLSVNRAIPKKMQVVYKNNKKHGGKIVKKKTRVLLQLLWSPSRPTVFLSGYEKVSGCITFCWVTHWQRHQVHTRRNTCCLCSLCDYSSKGSNHVQNEWAQREPQRCDWQWDVKMSFRCQIKVLCEIRTASKSPSWKVE